jgi:hypothetical protein
MDRRLRHSGLEHPGDEVSVSADLRHVTCRSRVSARCGNQPITSAAHSCCDITGPLGVTKQAVHYKHALRTRGR